MGGATGGRAFGYGSGGQGGTYDGDQPSGGGGGGYFGGGAGCDGSNGWGYGGGGGSGYVLAGGVTTAGNFGTPGGTSDPDYVAPVGTPGNDGRVVIRWGP